MELKTDSTLSDIVEYLRINIPVQSFDEYNVMSKLEFRKTFKVLKFNDAMSGLNFIKINTTYSVDGYTTYTIINNVIHVRYEIDMVSISHTQNNIITLNFTVFNEYSNSSISSGHDIGASSIRLDYIPSTKDEIFNIELIYPEFGNLLSIYNILMDNKLMLDEYIRISKL